MILCSNLYLHLKCKENITGHASESHPLRLILLFGEMSFLALTLTLETEMGWDVVVEWY